MKVTKKAIENVLGGILAGAESELQAMSRDDLEGRWFFKWDLSKSFEQNTYNFYDLLKLYGSFCRRWEERHHGSCCVVERVRDQYLMPKIREFTEKMRAESAAELASLRAENERLRSALEIARDYVAGELASLRQMYKGYEKLGRVPETEQDLAAIDAAMSRDGGGA